MLTRSAKSVRLSVVKVVAKALHQRDGYRISDKGGLLMNNKMSVYVCCPLSANSTSGGVCVGVVGGGGG